MPDETFVQVLPDSTGKKIRNIRVTTYIADPTTGEPTPTTVLMQVIALADEQGNVIDNFVDYEFQANVIELLTQIRDGLAFILGKPLGE